MPKIPAANLVPRRGGGGGHSGGGHSGGGHSGGGHSGGSHSGGSSKGSKGTTSHGAPPSGRKSGSEIDGLPKGRNKVTTYGKGGGHPVEVKNGPLKGWRVGGGARSEVYGSSFHPTTPAPNTLPWGFPPIVVILEINVLEQGADPYTYYHSLPQNVTNLGGGIVEMKITPNANNTPSFFFISDTYSAGEVKGAITLNCTDVTASDPIPFNSTGDIQPGSVVQFYRGDSAAILLQGYDDAKESPGYPSSIPNPPFPSSVNMTTWGCLNSTIGASIPLLNGPPGVPFWAILISVVLPLFLIGFILYKCGRHGACHCDDDDDNDDKRPIF